MVARSYASGHGELCGDSAICGRSGSERAAAHASVAAGSRASVLCTQRNCAGKLREERESLREKGINHNVEHNLKRELNDIFLLFRLFPEF
jgi:hypothetical protein